MSIPYSMALLSRMLTVAHSQGESKECLARFETAAEDLPVPPRNRDCKAPQRKFGGSGQLLHKSMENLGFELIPTGVLSLKGPLICLEPGPNMQAKGPTVHIRWKEGVQRDWRHVPGFSRYTGAVYWPLP